MGLKLLPENGHVFVYEKAEADAWGFAKLTNNKKRFGCLIRESEGITPIESVGGKQILPSYIISFNGKVEIKAGDKLEVYGEVLEVLNKKITADLSGNILLTKITV